MSSLEIMLGKEVYKPGEKVDGQILLKLDKRTKARDIAVEIYGNEHTHITRLETRVVPNGKGGVTTTTVSVTYTEDVAVINEGTSLMEKAIGTYEPGKKIVLTPNIYTLPFSFTLPEDATPTYNGEHAEVYYNVSAKVDVPWWSDIDDKKSFRVIPEEGVAKEGEPIQLEAKKGQIYMQVDLNKKDFKRGEHLEGKVKINNDAGKKIRKVLIDLYANEHARAEGHTEDSTVMRYTQEIPIDPPETIYFEKSFKIQIPHDAIQTINKRYFSIDWYFKAGLDIAMAIDLEKETSIKVK